jgi:hypothetical protein
MGDSLDESGIFQYQANHTNQLSSSEVSVSIQMILGCTPSVTNIHLF